MTPFWTRRWFMGAALVTGVTVAGTLGYIVIEGWSLFDALYMTVITVTTVGYREVHPMSRAGEAFTMALLFVGVGTVFYVASLGVAAVIEGRLALRWDARRRGRMIDTLHGHFIVCGYGRMGRIIVEEFRRQGVPHVVVDREPELIHQVIERGGLGITADASSEDVLQRIGVHRARGLIAAVGTDAENVYIVLSARLLRPDLYIIGRAETDDAVRKLRKAGADRVISPYQIGAQQIAMTALRPAVVDFVQLATSAEHLELTIEQVRIARDASLVGQSLLGANLRQRFGVVVVGIQRATGKMEFNPPPEALMQAGDQLIVMGKPDNLKQLELIAQTSDRSLA